MSSFICSSLKQGGIPLGGILFRPTKQRYHSDCQSASMRGRVREGSWWRMRQSFGPAHGPLGGRAWQDRTAGRRMVAAEQGDRDGMPVHEPPRYAWMNGGFVEWTDARLHVETLTVQGGLNVYEVIGAFWSEEVQQLFLFRPDAHLRRMQRSAKVM